jgi:hypothetical protein
MSKKLILWYVNLDIKKMKTCTHIFKQLAFKKYLRNFSSCLLPGRLLCMGSATSILVFCFSIYKGEYLSRAVIFIPRPPHHISFVGVEVGWGWVWKERAFGLHWTLDLQVSFNWGNCAFVACVCLKTSAGE